MKKFDSRPQEKVIKKYINLGDETPEFKDLLKKKESLKSQLQLLKEELEVIKDKLRKNCPHLEEHTYCTSRLISNDRMWYHAFTLRCRRCNSILKDWHN